jgi:cytidyltransferase-like protein
MKKVAVAGGFDPLHVGHLRHLQLASKLGDYLIVLVRNNEDMVRKKGYCFMPLEDRMEILRGLRCVDEVVPTIDKDGTMGETLKKVKPDIFAKGGDRTPENIPQNEVEACKEIGCEIIYGVGEQYSSSQKIIRETYEKLSDIQP